MNIKPLLRLPMPGRVMGSLGLRKERVKSYGNKFFKTNTATTSKSKHRMIFTDRQLKLLSLILKIKKIYQIIVLKIVLTVEFHYCK